MSKRQKKAPSPDVLFGELRAIVQQPPVQHGQRINLWNLCGRMHRYHPDLYVTQWVPYLEAYASVWQPELIVVRSLEELEKAITLAPFARFTLAPKSTGGVYALGASAKQSQELRNSTRMKHVASLRVGDMNTLSVLLDAPHIATLRSIRASILTHGSPIDLLYRLARSPHRESLHTIQVKGNDYEQLPHPPFDDFLSVDMPSLRILEIEHIALPRPHLDALLVSKFLTPLHHLSLAHTALHEEWLELLATRSDKLESLESLDLSGLRRVTGKATWLTKALDTTPDLKHLAIRDSFADYRPTALATYLAARTDSKLESLDLSRSNIGVRAIQVIAKSAHLKHLHTIDLRGGTLARQTIKLLATHPFFGRLEHLDVNPKQLDARDAEELASSSTLAPHLTHKFGSWHDKLHTWPNT